MEKSEQIKLHLKINEEAMGFWHSTLKHTDSAMEYLSNIRKLNTTTIQDFVLGFSDGSVSEYLLKYFSYNDLLESGLFYDNDGTLVDKFKNRIIFPNIIEGRHVAGFSGRPIQKDIMPKYINSSESIVYNKSSILYGLFLSKLHILYNKYAILVEGHMDCISLWQRGIYNVVASCGTAFTKYYAKRLYALTDKVIVLYDSDKAGIKASEKAVEILKNSSINGSILRLPYGYDPDSFIIEFGKSELDDLISGCDLI